MHIRQVVLDTETTGLSTTDGHRIIEIGAVEMVNRRITKNRFHHYINPERLVDPEAFQVHGISDDFLKDKPVFAEIAQEFVNFIRGDELIIHNASFDVGFINYELSLLDNELADVQCNQLCQIHDTLAYARRKHPGQPNSLDALCKRYGIDNSNRELHGALLDANILAQVYLAMTSGQFAMSFDEHRQSRAKTTESKLNETVLTKLIPADDSELHEHEKFIQMLKQKSDESSLWD